MVSYTYSSKETVCFIRGCIIESECRKSSGEIALFRPQIRQSYCSTHGSKTWRRPSFVCWRLWMGIHVYWWYCSDPRAILTNFGRLIIPIIRPASGINCLDLMLSLIGRDFRKLNYWFAKIWKVVVLKSSCSKFAWVILRSVWNGL
jgi:hypothetical protein